MQNPLNQSASAFPLLEFIHLAGIVCGVGTAALVDFRLLNVGLTRSSAAQVWKAVLPWTLGGLTLAIFSGLLLFSVDPEKYYVNGAFRFKMVCLLLAIMFHFLAVRKSAGAGKGLAVACVSVGLWALVPLGGIFLNFIDSIDNAGSYGYPALLWLHILSLVFLGGLVVATDLRLLGLAMPDCSIPDVADRLRVPKRCFFLVAAFTGVALFAAKAAHSADIYNRWFWIKLALLLLIAANYFVFRRTVLAGSTPQRATMAACLSLLLSAAVLGCARGPATVKDIMHSMVDPSGDYLFQSVQTIADEHGVREKAPRTDADWEDVRLRVTVLLEAQDSLTVPGRMAAQPKDRSKNPAVEDEPWQIQELLDSEHPEFIRRARKLHDAAAIAMKAVDAKDQHALLLALDGIDKACEGCHLHFWYPNDQRAREAARQDGVLE